MSGERNGRRVPWWGLAGLALIICALPVLIAIRYLPGDEFFPLRCCLVAVAAVLMVVGSVLK